MIKVIATPTTKATTSRAIRRPNTSTSRSSVERVALGRVGVVVGLELVVERRGLVVRVVVRVERDVALLVRSMSMSVGFTVVEDLLLPTTESTTGKFFSCSIRHLCRI